MCDVFVDLEIGGLSFAHLIVKRHKPSDNGFLGENEVIPSETIYRYIEPDEKEEDDRIAKTKIMKDDFHEISVENQSLRLAKVVYMTDALKFATKHEKYHPFEQFTFSVESISDADGTKDNSGAYNMNVDSIKADLDPMIAI